MANSDLADNFGESGPSYRSPKKKRPFWKYFLIIFGVLILLGLATCVTSLTKLYGYAEERQLATAAFIEQIQEDGLPDADAEIWSPSAGVTEEAVANLRSMMAHFGAAEKIGEPACQAQAYASNSSSSGTYVKCSTPMTYAATPGQIDITWRREAEEWKVFWFHSNYVDASTYYEAEARRKLVSEGVLDPVRPEVEPVED